MPHSHHSHSGQFCKHAVGTLQDVVREAINQGFETYGLTEHVPRYRPQDLYPEESELSIGSLADQFDAYLAEAHRLKSLYSAQITLLVGLETEYITPVDLDQLLKLIDRNQGQVEYLVGSVHHVNGIPIDFDLETYQRCIATIPLSLDSEGVDETNLEHKRQCAFLEMYFDAQHELMQRIHPEIIGHIDLCRLYSPALRLHDYTRAWARLERNVKYAVSYGALFEANAAAFRKGWDGAYPGEDVVELIRQCGGRFSLSDDSHGPHAVGLNYGRLRNYLRRVGVHELWVLERTGVPNPAGRPVKAVRVEGRWWEHVFWEGKDSGDEGQVYR